MLLAAVSIGSDFTYSPTQVCLDRNRAGHAVLEPMLTESGSRHWSHGRSVHHACSGQLFKHRLAVQDSPDLRCRSHSRIVRLLCYPPRPPEGKELGEICLY